MTRVLCASLHKLAYSSEKQPSHQWLPFWIDVCTSLCHMVLSSLYFHPDNRTRWQAISSPGTSRGSVVGQVTMDHSLYKYLCEQWETTRKPKKTSCSKEKTMGNNKFEKTKIRWNKQPTSFISMSFLASVGILGWNPGQEQLFHFLPFWPFDEVVLCLVHSNDYYYHHYVIIIPLCWLPTVAS